MRNVSFMANNFTVISTLELLLQNCQVSCLLLNKDRLPCKDYLVFFPCTKKTLKDHNNLHAHLFQLFTGRISTSEFDPITFFGVAKDDLPLIEGIVEAPFSYTFLTSRKAKTLGIS